MHDFGVCSNGYHDSTSCPTHVLPVHGITACTRAIAVLDPLLLARYYNLRCGLVFLYILSTVPFPKAATRELLKSVCLRFV